MNKISRSLYILFLNSLLLLLYIGLNSFTWVNDTAKTSSFKFKTIIIDAGHGGKDPGAHGTYSVEKNVALAIAKKLRREVAEELPNLNVVMTRTDDTFIELNKRSAIANENQGNLFISIHCNSSPAGTANRQKGVMLLVYGFHRVKEQLEAIRENSSIYIEKDYKKKYASYDETDPTNLIILNLYMQKYRKQSIHFADLLNNEFKYTDNRPSIGVKEQGVLVLAHSAMPAVLVETGYINNATEEDYLNSNDGQEEIVQSIIRAIKTYKKELSN
ncbi:MAG TPA: N-acetylmuramoyl-L-alanine amidase [Mucilaginibacter sp.]